MAASEKQQTKKFKPLERKTVKMNKFQSVITINWRNVGNFNPLVLSMLAKTHEGVWDKVVLAELDDEGIEIALAVAGPAEPDALPLSFAKSGTTATCRFTILNTKYPMLKAPRGRVRAFPVSVRTEPDRSYLVLNMKESTLVVPEIRRRGKDDVASTVQPEQSSVS